MKKLHFPFLLTLLFCLSLSIEGFTNTSFDPCPVNASAGKRAHVKTTQIRRKPAKRHSHQQKPSENTQRKVKPQNNKPAKEHKARPEKAPKPAKEPKVKKAKSPKQKNTSSDPKYHRHKGQPKPVFSQNKSGRKHTTSRHVTMSNF